MRFLRIFIPILLALTVGAYVYVRHATKHDTTPPTLTCDADRIEVSVADTDEALLSHVKSADAKDGDLTDSVIIENISAFLEGNEAKATFAVCDHDNNVAKLEIPIVYTDYVKPEFSLSEPLIFYEGTQKINTTTNVTATDLIDGELTGRVVQSRSELDPSMPGVYPVTFRVTTSKGVTSEVTLNAYVLANKLPRNIVLSEYLVYTDVGKKIDAKSFLVEYPQELIDNSTWNNTYSLSIKDGVKYDQPGHYAIEYAIVQRTISGDTTRESKVAQTYLNVVVRGEAS